MSVRYADYLPKRLKGTRWEQLIDVTQTLIEDFLEEKIYRLKYRYDYILKQKII